MKKISAFLATALLGIMPASAQMIAYEVTTTTADYVGLEGATVVDLQGTVGTDLEGLMLDADGNMNFNTAEDVTGFPIGFDFDYNGQTMKYFLIGTDGEIQLSPTQVITTDLHKSAASFFKNSGIHDAFGITARQGAYGYADTEISYKTEGEAGSRVLTIQYKNLGFQTTWSADADECGNKAQIQYRLYEATGNIAMQVSGFQPQETGNYHFMHVGILGDPYDFVQIYSWDGEEYGASDNTISYSPESYPADGTTWTFHAPEPCLAPGGTVANVELSSTSTQISGQFKSTDADHYLVLATTDAEINATPADKTKYAVGAELGNARVVAVASAFDADLNWIDNNSFKTPNDLQSATNYVLAIVPFNSMCSAGPLYGQATTFSIATKPAAPEELTIVAAGKNSVTLSVKSAGSPVLVAMSDRVQINDIGQSFENGWFGQPEGIYAVGDAFDYEYFIVEDYEIVDTATGQNKVVYVGGSSDAIEVTGLEPGKAYYFRAWSSDGNGAYSSLYLDQSTVTTATLPWTFVPDMEGSFTPVGWTMDEDYTWTNSTRGDVPYFTNQISFTDTEELKTSWMESPAIELAPDATTLKVEVAASMFTFRTFSAPTYEMLDGEEIALQLTTDGVEYKNILTINKDNMPAVEANPEEEIEAGNYWLNGVFAPFSVDFTEYAGQTVRLRLFIKRYTNGGVSFRNLALKQQGAYEFLPTEWIAGDPGRISPDNVVVNADGTITVDKAGQNNVALVFRSANVYKIPATDRFFVIKAKGLSTEATKSYLWWLNNTNNGGQYEPTDMYEDEDGCTVFAWDARSLPIGGTLGNATTDFKDEGGWSTTFGMTLADDATPAVITYIGFSNTTKNTPEEFEYEFVASEWPAGDPGRISPSNVVVDETLNTITVDAKGANNVALNFKTDKLYYVAEPVKYFVIKATGLSTEPTKSYLWWLNAKNNGAQIEPTKTVTDADGVTTFLWDINENSAFASGFNADGYTYLDGQGAGTWGWTTTFGMTLANDEVPAVFSYIGFASDDITTGINAQRTINAQSTDIFNLQGQRVSTPQKGIVVVNGKKMIVK
jgi:hypothetical protein